MALSKSHAFAWLLYVTGVLKMEKWIVMTKKADFNAIAGKFGIDPVIARILRNRDIVGDDAIREYLYGGLEYLKDPFALKDMDRAVSVLKEKIRSGAKIRIMGDYDIDGIMASYILKTGLTSLGGTADIRIPDRVKDGYGFNEHMVKEAHEDGIDTILTCDNGIAANEPVALAKKLGMTVIITDHHEVMSIPEADAVVDPKRTDDESGSGNLCGAAIAWKLILALGGDREMGMLQYAAFATVGDIVELTGENRIIVKEGLKQLRETDNTGLRELCDVTGVEMSKLSAYHIGFVLGPCLNASGRLDTAMRALDLLEASSEKNARACAEELKELNESRKAMTENGVKEAMEEIRRQGYEDDKVLVVFLPEVHESVTGIIAGRIRETYMRPTIVLTRSGDIVKGSGRSTEAYSMFDELVKAEDLLIRFGGHPMAAGLSIKEERVDALRERLNANCTLTDEDLVAKVRIDVPMPISYVTHELIRQISLLEPFGKGNEKPLFAQKHVFFDHPRIFGAKHTLLKARVRSMNTGDNISPGIREMHSFVEGPEIDAVCFKDVDLLQRRIEFSPDLSIVYEPEINDYLGQSRLQIVIRYFQ